jgi:hypothetical protein
MPLNELTKLIGSNPASRVASISAIVYESIDIYNKYSNHTLNGTAVVQAIALLVLGFVTNEITPTSVYNNRRK